VRTWFVSVLLLATSCSEKGVRSGSGPEPADFLPSGDSVGPGPGREGDTFDTASEQPRLVLRCEKGRVGAYIVVRAEQEPGSDDIDSAAVPVYLDSAPGC
jgi:hypothetical protein